MWNKPSTNYWFISPTYQQALSLYRRMVGMLWASPGLLLKKNQTELRIKLNNMSQCRFISGEILHNLRGETLNGVIIDEVRAQHKDLWPMIIRPMLSTTKGWARFISTPNGFDHFYDLSQNHSLDPHNWAFFQTPSTANPLFSSEEFEAAKADMSEPQFAQEILALFRDLTSGKTYLNFSDKNLSQYCPWHQDHPWSPYLPVVLGCDFNITPMSWTLGQTRAEEWWWFDEIVLKNSHTPEAAKELVHRIHAMQASGHRADPALVICGDATSKARQRAAGGESDYTILKGILRDAKITFTDKTPDSNPAVKDRVNNVNAKLQDAAGSQHLWLQPAKVPHLKKDLERVVWKPGAEATLDQTTDKDRTHSSDSIGYPIHELTPIKQIRNIGSSRILHRVF